MLKREIVGRQIADAVLEDRRTTFHQRELAAKLGMSPGNVHLALEPLRAVGAARVVGKNLVVRDVRKILLLWAARRQPARGRGSGAALRRPVGGGRLLRVGLPARAGGEAGVVNDFYRDAQVRGAGAGLTRLQRVVPDAVILGGWAVYLYARGQRSTDVDIAVDFGGLGQLQREFGPALTRNSNLRKYELIIDRVEVDIFVGNQL